MTATDTESDPHMRVVVHIHVTTAVRKALRLIAAERGVSAAELVSHWALAEARALGLPVGSRNTISKG